LVYTSSHKMIQDFKVSDQPAHRVIFREALACLAWGVCYPFGIRKSGKRTQRKADQRTVVFIHGYLANPASFLPLSAYLRSCGHKQVLSFRYRSKDGIEQAAKELRTFLREHVRGGRIDLVCHSLGGVIARVYLEEMGGSRRVDRCITLGTPHAGTYNSYWVNTRIGRELRPDSELMQRLNARQPAKANYTAIVGGSDNIIIPRVFASRENVTVHIPDVGHVGLLFSSRVFFEVARQLSLPIVAK
jgi:triacylglycerol lipase